MDRQEIERKTGSLPVSELGKVAEDQEIWEGNEPGVHFKITRHLLPLSGPSVEIYVLSVSGEPDARSRLVDDFCDAMGEPESISTENDIGFVTWLRATEAF